LGLDIDRTRERIATNIGQLTDALLSSVKTGSLVVFGGDTLNAVMRSVGADGVYPMQEIQPGIVHSTFMHGSFRKNLITKSGGFGKKESILQIERYVWCSGL